MNVDHFFWIDSTDVLPNSSLPPTPSSPSTLSFFRPLLSLWNTYFTSSSSSFSFGSPPPVLKTTKKKDTLPKELATDYLALPKLDKLDLNMFAPIVNVAPSVVTMYYPAVRVFTYNVSGLNDEEGLAEQRGRRARSQSSGIIEEGDEEEEDIEDGELNGVSNRTDTGGSDSTSIGIEYVLRSAS